MPQVTISTILDYLQDSVAEEIEIGPHRWIDAAQKLNILSGEETDKLWALQQEVAKAKVENIENGDSVAKAKAKIEASDAYREMKQQEAKIERIQEMVRIAKIQARLKDNEFQNQ